jgi:hypothetical protein
LASAWKSSQVQEVVRTEPLFNDVGVSRPPTLIACFFGAVAAERLGRRKLGLGSNDAELALPSLE